MTLLAGWQVHPENPAYGWNPATNGVKPIQEVTGTPALAAPVAAPAPAQAAAPAPMEFGAQDLDAASQDLARGQERASFTRDSNWIWLSFMQNVIEAVLLLRFMPPWARDERKAYIESARHRIYARLVPDAPEGRDIMYFDCFDMVGGPGNCPLCRVIMNDVVNSTTQGADEFAKESKARPSMLWQAVNLLDPASHYQEITDPTGQTQMAIVPGLFRIGPMMHNALLECFRNGDFTHMDIGYPIECIRKKTGSLRYDVDYKANHQAQNAGRIDESLITVLYNLVDLRKEGIIFNKAERMELVAQNILSYYGSASGGQVAGQIGGWVPHPSSPGWEYDPQTGNVRQIAVAPTPPAQAALPAPAPAQAAAPAPAAQVVGHPPPAQFVPSTPVLAQPAAPALASVPTPPAPITAGQVPISPPAPPAPPAAPVQGVIPPPAAPGIAAAPTAPAQPPVPAPGMPAAAVPTAPPVPAVAVPTAAPPMSPAQLQQRVAAGATVAPAPPAAPGVALAPPALPAPPAAPVMEPPPAPGTGTDNIPF